jgi:SAM-dependent methyltransferase
MTAANPCRFCGAALTRTFLDLGATPLANALPADAGEAEREESFPLHVMVCDACLLVQVAHAVPPESIFADGYAYLSSYSPSWVEHARCYAETMIDRFGLDAGSTVVEVASNDGYLLRHFRERAIPVLGIEPARNVARIAEAAGIATETAFFDERTARNLAARGVAADLMVANNVLAHVPDIRDFAAGFAVLLKPEGVATFEFPHLLNLIAGVQFDTIYHEHYSYLSLHVVERVFAAVGLRVFDVEELPTHGGSLRVFACREAAGHGGTTGLEAVRAKERAARLDEVSGHIGFAPRVEAVREGFRKFLAAARREGRTIAGYGAAAKGNTFLNHCAVTAADIAFVVDRNPEKQGRLLPGSHIPVRPPEALCELRPDYVLILPWNLAGEIMSSMAHIREWGGRFVVAVPEIEVL